MRYCDDYNIVHAYVVDELVREALNHHPTLIALRSRSQGTDFRIPCPPLGLRGSGALQFEELFLDATFDVFPRLISFPSLR